MCQVQQDGRVSVEVLGVSRCVLLQCRCVHTKYASVCDVSTSCACVCRLPARTLALTQGGVQGHQEGRNREEGTPYLKVVGCFYAHKKACDEMRTCIWDKSSLVAHVIDKVHMSHNLTPIRIPIPNRSLACRRVTLPHVLHSKGRTRRQPPRCHPPQPNMRHHIRDNQP